PLSGCHGDRVAADPAGADQVAGLRARLAIVQRALEILPPERPLAPAGQQPDVVRGILIPAKLVIRRAVVLESADEEVASTPGPQLTPAQSKLLGLIGRRHGAPIRIESCARLGALALAR